MSVSCAQFVTVYYSVVRYGNGIAIKGVHMGHRGCSMHMDMCTTRCRGSTGIKAVATVRAPVLVRQQIRSTGARIVVYSKGRVQNAHF